MANLREGAVLPSLTGSSGGTLQAFWLPATQQRPQDPSSTIAQALHRCCVTPPQHPPLTRESKPNVAKQANPFPPQTPVTKHGSLQNKWFWRRFQWCSALLAGLAGAPALLSLLGASPNTPTPQRDDEALRLAMFQSSGLHRAGTACGVAGASRGEG